MRMRTSGWRISSLSSWSHWQYPLSLSKPLIFVWPGGGLELAPTDSVDLEVVMPRIDVVSLVGSAVPAQLRANGRMVCWRLLIDGQPMAGPFVSREAALACQAVWLLSGGMRREGDSLLA
jgi:hypothetical protein